MITAMRLVESLTETNLPHVVRGAMRAFAFQATGIEKASKICAMVWVLAPSPE